MRQNFKIKKYNWSIVIYYTVNEAEKKEIIDMLEGINCDSRTLDSIKRNLSNAEIHLSMKRTTWRCTSVRH